MVKIEIVAIIIGIIIVGIVAFFGGVAYRKNKAEKKIGAAEERYHQIIDNAIKEGEDKKREKILEGKEEYIKLKNELDKEVRERRSELQQLEKRLLHKGTRPYRIGARIGACRRRTP